MQIQNKTVLAVEFTLFPSLSDAVEAAQQSAGTVHIPLRLPNLPQSHRKYGKPRQQTQLLRRLREQ